MNSRSPLLYLGIVLMVVGGTRLAMSMGLTGLSSGFWAIFAVGLLLTSREPARQLAERVRLLEAKLAERDQQAVPQAPPAA
jgi:hypothetical protein